MGTSTTSLLACSCCGLIQHLPPIGRGQLLRCGRCHSRLAARRRSTTRTAALALSALMLYPAAISLPIMVVEQFGVSRPASVWSGGIGMIADGELLVGLVVLLASVVLPLLKLVGLFLLAGGGYGLRPSTKAWTWHVVEWTGRWGMLDVLLVAILVATIKLGALMQLHAGPGALAFTACVLLNLAASASFDPHSLWEAEQ
jgi:paraquat-inducible protein A